MSNTLEIDSYAVAHRGIITASKLKTFMKCPFTYFKKYEELTIEEGKTKSLELGTQIDDFVSYGKNKFFEKYVFEESLLKADLQEKLDDLGIYYDDKAKVEDLKALYYGDRERITPAVSQKIQSITKDLERQKLFLLDDGSYEAQHRIECTYKGLVLRGTLDRFSFDKKEIRDTKTTADTRYHKAIRDYGYLFSMSFYDLLVEIKHGFKAEKVILDFITTGGHPVYMPVLLQRDTLEEKRIEIIKVLDFYIECKEQNIWPTCQDLYGGSDSMFPAYFSCPYPEHCDGAIPKSPIIFQEYS